MERTNLTREQLASYIDHTLLKPDASLPQIKKICEEAKTYHFASVCVNSYWIPTVAAELAGTDIAPCSVIGFPLGAGLSSSKAAEAKDAIAAGAKEIDMVINVGAIKSGDWDGVKKDIEAVNAVKGGAKLKVIIETCLLTDEEKVKACQASMEAGADFVKTSTGFSTGGAKAKDVALMKKSAGGLKVKASGGIHSYEEAMEMIEAGADRIGASAGIAIISGLEG